MTNSCSRFFYGVRYAAARHDMVVFDHHCIEESEPVIESSSASNSVFFKCPQAWCGFSRANDSSLCSVYGAHKLVSGGSNSRKMTQKIERDPLRAEQGSSRSLNPQDFLARLHLSAIRHFGCHMDATVPLAKGLHRELDPSNNTGLLGEDAGAALLVAADRGHRSDVAREPEVFGKCRANAALDQFWIE